MNMTRAVLAIGVAAWLGACASAPPPTPTSTPAATPAVAQPAAAKPAAKQTETARLDPNEVICRRQITTGSRFAETRCQTRLQWDMEQREARKQTEDSQGSVGPPQT
ncbi:MAG: hypothetical protein NAOJABEB_03225 [Steroidobacteraceae bacterium]|nr:hypothetical protein [Steroidobacteraceae bacterium]